MQPLSSAVLSKRVLLASAAGLAGAALASPASAQAGEAAAMADRFAATLSAHDMEAFAALFAEDYVNHQASAAAPPPAPGRSMKAGTVAFFAARLAGLPDLSVTVESMVAAGDRVAASFVYAGTHGGTYMGVAPTGRAIRFTSCDIFTVRGGQFAQHWGMGDIAGLLAQLKA